VKCPDVGGIFPVIILASVDLPMPLGHTRPTICLPERENEIFSKTGVCVYVLLSP
jgi:hypothetical protein